MSDVSEAVAYAEEPELSAEEFLALARVVWPGEYSLGGAQGALQATINLTARLNGKLVGSVRVLTDGYFFGTIPEVIVHPEHQGLGIGRRLMELAWERSPTGLFFGAQGVTRDSSRSLVTNGAWRHLARGSPDQRMPGKRAGANGT